MTDVDLLDRSLSEWGHIISMSEWGGQRMQEAQRNGDLKINFGLGGFRSGGISFQFRSEGVSEWGCF